MPSKPRKSSFTPAGITLEHLEIEPVRLARGETVAWKLVAKVTVSTVTADGRRFGTKAATLRIPVYPEMQTRAGKAPAKSRAAAKR